MKSYHWKVSSRFKPFAQPEASLGVRTQGSFTRGDFQEDGDVCFPGRFEEKLVKLV